MNSIDPDACTELLIALATEPGLKRSDRLAQVTEDYPQLTTQLRKEAEHIYQRLGSDSVIDWFEAQFEN